MDEDLYKYQRMNPSAPAASHVAALNKTMQAGGVNTNGLSGANVVNEYAARMRDPRQVAMDSKRRFRGMSSVQRAQYMDQEVVRNEAMLGQQAHQVNLHNPFGATLDEQHQNDREFYAPGTRAVVESARRNFDEQFAGLMTGANKQAWGSTKDIERAVNGLEATQKYGPLIENHIQQRVRASLSPAVQAQFEAHDKNVQSFVDFQKANGDGRPEDEIAQDFDNPALQSQWRGDINARKFEAHPSGKGIVEVPASPQAQAEAEMGNRMKLESGQRKQRSDQSHQWLAGDPERMKQYDVGPDGELMPKQKPPEDIATTAARNAAVKKAEIDAEISAGLRKPDAKPEAPEEVAAVYAQGGVPVPTHPKTGKPVLPLTDDGKENPIYNAMTEKVWIGPGGVESKSPIAGTEPTRRLKPQFKQWSPAQDPAVAKRNAEYKQAALKALADKNETPERKQKAREILAKLQGA